MAIPRKRKRLHSTSNFSPSKDATVHEIFQVEDIGPSTLRQRISFILETMNTTQSLKFPPRKSPNLIYIPELDRVCMKKYEDLELTDVTLDRQMKFKSFFNIIYDLSFKDESYICKRGIYYFDKELFGSQQASDDLIDDACCMLGCTRRSLRVTASITGWVIGSVVIKENGKVFDLSKHDIRGKSICPYMFDFDILSCDAKFILVVEKYVSYAKLIDSKFYKKVPCIIITGNGMPDVATRFFLRNLSKKLHNRLPVLALTDSDPHGVEIMSVYRCCSENLAFDSENLATPHINWIGVRPADWDLYCGTSDMMKSNMNESDVEKAISLRARECFCNKTLWVNELDKMIVSKTKYDLDTLSSKNLLKKLSLEDWLTADEDGERSGLGRVMDIVNQV